MSTIREIITAAKEDRKTVVQERELTLQGPHKVQAPNLGLGVAEAHLDLGRRGHSATRHSG